MYSVQLQYLAELNNSTVWFVKPKWILTKQISFNLRNYRLHHAESCDLYSVTALCLCLLSELPDKRKIPSLISSTCLAFQKVCH